MTGLVDAAGLGYHPPLSVRTPRFYAPLLAVCGLLLVLHRLAAQAVPTHPAPLTAWIDLRPAAPGTAPQSAPTWVEAFEYVPVKASVAAAETVSVQIGGTTSVDQTITPGNESVYRVRLHRPVAGVGDLQVRLFYQDQPGAGRPRVSVWNELGDELMRSAPLGQGLGLPTSDTLTVPMDGADYLEFAAPGDGSQLRAVFLTWLEKTEVRQPADFPARETVREPFGIVSATRTRQEDSYLYGVVTALLQGADPVVLNAVDSPAVKFEFQLERQPLVAVVSYEVLGATLAAAPTVAANQTAALASELHLPDLADPGYRGEMREGDAHMGFRYTGWVHAQKVIAGEDLAAGLNNLTVALSKGSDTVAIRSVQIQLKYNWEKLDYILSPAVPSAPDSHDPP